MSEFLHMGGYASFVWSSYALAFILMFGMLLISSMSHKKIIKNIQGRVLREEQARLESESK